MLRLVHPQQGEEAGPSSGAELDHVSTQLSALLLEMVRAQEAEVATTWDPELKPGGAVGRFKLVRELGRGGFGVVYEAVDRELSRTVALKVVRPGTRIAARGGEWMMREAEAVARLNHPNIITLHDLGQGPSGPYLVFELLRGRTLAERLRPGPVPPDEAIDIALAVSRALVHAHAAGVVHRDLTAANVHLGADGAVKVLDFGLAHLFGRDGANDGGTPAYMAPEQWDGDNGDGRTDLFALGVILFQALSGRYPYKVEKGWSEALEPGETPRLPQRAAPRRLARLVRALIDREPDRRPQSVKAVRDELLAIRAKRDGAGKQRVLWGLGVVATAAVAAATWLSLRHQPPPGEQVHVVMAAMENGAGEPTLDAVPGLLSAALEPSQRVKLVSPSRLAYASRQAGLGEPGKIDAARGRSLARLAGAEVVLVPSSWKEDGSAVVAVRALESEGGQALFTAKALLREQASLAKAVDALSDRIRRELNERAADRKLRRPVAELVTESAEAARWYYQGVDCLRTRTYTNGSATQCAPAFEQALALDPTFPLAHYQLALANYLLGDSGDQARPHLERAMRSADRLPHRERRLMEALALRLGGRGSEAQQIYDELLAVTPEDPQILAQVVSLLLGQDDWDGALRYLQRWAAAAPDEQEAQSTLIQALGRRHRTDELRLFTEQLARRPKRPWALLVEAQIWQGDPDGALETARAAVATDGASELGTLCLALLAEGDYLELEEQGRRLLDRTPGSMQALGLVEQALVGQGRITDALRWGGEEVAAQLKTPSPQRVHRQAMVAAGSWQPALAWRYAARAYALDPALAADLAIPLALLGDRGHAQELAVQLKRDSYEEEEYRALSDWKAGDSTRAISRLELLEERDPWPVVGLAPAYLLAEIHAELKDDVGTLAAVARFRRLPADRVWRSWAFPRALLLSVRAHARLGEQVAAARERDRLLRMLSRSDREFPLREQAELLSVTK